MKLLSSCSQERFFFYFQPSQKMSECPVIGPEKSCLQHDGQLFHVHTICCVIITSNRVRFLWGKKQIKSCRCLHTEIITCIYDLQSVELIIITGGIEDVTYSTSEKQSPLVEKQFHGLRSDKMTSSKLYGFYQTSISWLSFKSGSLSQPDALHVKWNTTLSFVYFYLPI